MGEMPEIPEIPDFRKVSRQKFPELPNDIQWRLLADARIALEQVIANATAVLNIVVDPLEDGTLNFRTVSRREWDQLSNQTRWELFADARIALEQVNANATTALEKISPGE